MVLGIAWNWSQPLRLRRTKISAVATPMPVMRAVIFKVEETSDFGSQNFVVSQIMMFMCGQSAGLCWSCPARRIIAICRAHEKGKRGYKTKWTGQTICSSRIAFKREYHATSIFFGGAISPASHASVSNSRTSCPLRSASS